MQALITDPQTPTGVRLDEVPDPRPKADEVLVEIELFTVIADHFPYAATLPVGSVAGFDAVGLVVRGTDGGSGPTVGTRVATLLTGNAWARLRAVPTGELAIVPDEVDPGQASAMLVPGLTALRVIRRLGTLTGNRLLVTGAGGAVGHFAVQLGRLAGAEVIASVRDLDDQDRVRALGATEVVTRLSDLSAPPQHVIDTVGGPLLAEAFDLLAEGGVIQHVGASSGQPTTFAPYQLVGRRRRIESFYAGDDGFGPDLAYLLDLMATGRLLPLDRERVAWHDIGAIAQRLKAPDTPRRMVVTTR